MPRIRETRRRLAGDRAWFTSGLWKRTRKIERLQTFRLFGHSANERNIYNSVRAMYSLQGIERCDRIAAHHELEYAYPFLDRDLVGFLMAVPGELVCKNGVPKALLRSAMKGVLPTSIVERKWKADGSAEFNRGVARDLPQYLSLFREGAKTIELGLLDAEELSEGIERLRVNFHNDGCNSTRQFTDLVGLELWLQTFFRKSETDNLEVA
jgi:asparagine synthetase B (glutamine-hydrolysing)